MTAKGCNLYCRQSLIELPGGPCKSCNRQLCRVCWLGLVVEAGQEPELCEDCTPIAIPSESESESESSVWSNIQYASETEPEDSDPEESEPELESVQGILQLQ